LIDWILKMINIITSMEYFFLFQNSFFYTRLVYFKVETQRHLQYRIYWNRDANFALYNSRFHHLAKKAKNIYTRKKNRYTECNYFHIHVPISHITQRFDYNMHIGVNSD